MGDFTLTADVYRIDIDDRIIFSSNIVPESVGTDGQPCAPGNGNCPIRAILDPLGVGQVLFFTNAIDTRTEGADVVAQKGYAFDAGSSLDLTALLSYNRTKVTGRKSQSAILPPEKLFDDTQVTLIEEGQPRVHHILQGVYRTGAWDFTLRGNYFGPVSGQGFTPGVKQTWGGKWLADVALGYRFSDAARLTVGADNVFDTYPDKWDPQTGAPFPQLGFTYGWETMPFGMNGGFYYARLDFRF
jgi:iron complex outermembrane receptor protein